jgi:recombination associated protein RdgC
MWFKNLQVYRLPTPWAVDLAKLDEQLARGEFTRCPSNQPMSRGWVSPRKDGALVYSLAGQWLLALAVEQRLLPSSVVNDEAKERAELLTEQQGYPPGRKQMKELKERVTEELMPRAFTRKRTTFVWIDPQHGWLVVDAGSPAKAEEVIEHLRHCLDDLPLQMLHTQLSPQSAMAGWLAGGDAPAGFTVDRDCELKSVAEEKAAVRYVRHPLEGEGIAEQIKAHLVAGKLPTRLALTWDERISFVLTEKLEVKRLAFLDVLKEEAEKSAEHADEQFDADFALMTGELVRFLPQLIDALGGEQVEAETPAPAASAANRVAAADTPPWEA